jgi:uncharacterized protein YjiS (DUF1127 family)
MSALPNALPLSAGLRHLGRSLSRLPARLMEIVAVSRSRKQLALLDDRLLHDIGLTRDQALTEASRPGWDAPSHWKA